MTANSPRTFATCWTELVISRCGGLSPTRSSTGWNGRSSAVASRWAKSGTSVAAALDGTAATQRTGARQRADGLGGGLDELVGEAAFAAAGLDQRVPAAVAEAGERAALLGAHVVAELLHLALGVGRHLLDVEQDRARAQVQRGLAHERGVERAGVARRGADRADAAVLRVGVVELLAQRAHQAAAVGAEGRHRLLLAPAQRGHVRVAVAVVVPVAAGHAHPARAVARRPRPRRRAPSASPRSGSCRG